MQKSKIQNRRYYLHRMIKKQVPAVRMDARNKTMYVGHGIEVENRYLSELQEKGYSLQLEII